jgi:hypothetical protein
MKLSKELLKEIADYCEKNPIENYWDYRDELSKEQVVNLVSENDNEVECEVYEAMIDQIYEMEVYFIKEDLIPEFEDKLPEDYNEDELIDTLRDYVLFNLNFDKLVNNVPDLTVLVYLYSNYDCTNSMDTMESSEYLQQVYQRVKTGVRKDDFMYEHINGAYGGSLFCFAFKASVEEIIEMKKDIKHDESILIPKGTQFGYFSSFQGTGSVFEKTTYRNFKLNTKEESCPEYDRIELVMDIEQSYSMNDVYGDSEFIN